MGSSASKGSDNDELVDNLLKDQYLKTPSIQQIFRAVDRGLYFTKENRKHAYDDTAWRSGNIHLSAPGIYCEVLENLELGRGMSFLNLGSGTGYLNTMAGLIIGSYGVNYGIEVHKDVIEYAYNRLEKFKSTAEAIDEYDFCEPKFFHGNFLHLSSENRLYDRVYCGTACPPSYENYMKNLIKVNGILVMPLEEILVKVKRTSETSWEKKSITPVNFANLIHPSPNDANKPQLLLSTPQPLSLQIICRTSIRQILLKIIREENPKLKNHRIRKDLRIPSLRNGSYIPAEYLGSDTTIQMYLFHKHSSPFAWVSPDNDDDDEQDDNSSMCREELGRTVRGLVESDEDMERNEEQTDGEEKESDEEKETPASVQRYQARMKRKKARQTSRSSSDSGADVEDMDVEYGHTSSLEGDARKKTEDGDGKGLKTYSKSESLMAGETGESPVEKSSDGAGCSSNHNVGSSAESDEDDCDEANRHIARLKYQKLREMMIRQHMAGFRKKKTLGSPSDKEESEDEDEAGTEPNEPPNVLPSHSLLMREKILALPLPRTIQSYLNFHRTF